MNAFRATPARTTLCLRSLRLVSCTRSTSVSLRSASKSFMRYRSLSNTSTSTKKTTSSGKGEPVILDPLVVCGPSGVGKGTVISRFLEVQQEQYTASLEMNDRTPQRKEVEKPVFLEFVFAVSHTSRPPRPTEVDGVHYHFVHKEAMKQLIELGTKDATEEAATDGTISTAWASSYFVEHANVHGNLYGTSWDAIVKVHMANQKTIGNTRVIRKAILDIDIQGVQHLKKIEQEQKVELERGDKLPFLLQPKYIFIAPPSLRSLQERLMARGTESQLSLVTRTNNAIHEMNYGLEMLRYALDERLDVMYRKSNNFHTVVVNGCSVNDTVDEFTICVDRLYNIDEFERPAHVNANKYLPDEPIQIYEDMM